MNPIEQPCPKCRAAAGQKCKNYLGKGKVPCPERTGKKIKTATHRTEAIRPPRGGDRHPDFDSSTVINLVDIINERKLEAVQYIGRQPSSGVSYSPARPCFLNPLARYYVHLYRYGLCGGVPADRPKWGLALGGWAGQKIQEPAPRSDW